MAQSVRRLEQLMRNQGGALPQWTAPADWCDAIVLLTSVAQSYALKTDAAGLKGTKLRISATAAIYMNIRTTALVPAATTTDGSAPILIIPQAAGGTATIVFPVSSGTTLSFVAAAGAGAVVTIEAFD